MSAVATENKTCLLTLVTPGSSDRVMKVYPSDAESEKIWLNTAPGIQRWEAVQRFFDRHAPRGQYVPKPVPYHSDSKDLQTPDLPASAIPVLNLEGAVFETLRGDAPAKPATLPEDSALLQQQVTALSQQVALLAEELQRRKASAEPIRDADPMADGAKGKAAEINAAPESKAHCAPCDLDFKNEHAIKIHNGRFHKK